ncbi:hypothetical protein PVAND_012608 [Polypedilum vanderplanki]|uniref:SCP domain-containing protein n=1 Tax=Polypedilum vanderplanki TaxID=319348 RepID=A0A9J6CM09_POLVA|nr:hypothetical protein PVAND_012608 [Polypedilum vanderplanki]
MKFKNIFRSFQLLSLFLLVTSEVDYCNIFCPIGKHIACGNNGDFGKSCTSDAKIVELTQENIETILNEHNRLRNRIASGVEVRFKTAARMTSMIWNKQLALFAELNARTCLFQHDECRNTEKFKYVGQNIAMTQANLDYPDLTVFLNNSINDWYGELKDASQSDIDSYQQTEKIIGHMTQLVNDRANEFGCAVVQFSDSEWKTSILVCDYSLTNMIGEKVYESGEIASKCTTGVNNKFEALCSENEVVDNL